MPFNRDTDAVEVVWTDGERDMFPMLWLRDNCQCPLCHNSQVDCRRLGMRQVPHDTTVADLKVRTPPALISLSVCNVVVVRQLWLI